MVQISFCLFDSFFEKNSMWADKAWVGFTKVILWWEDEEWGMRVRFVVCANFLKLHFFHGFNQAEEKFKIAFKGDLGLPKQGMQCAVMKQRTVQRHIPHNIAEFVHDAFLNIMRADIIK